MLGAAFEYVPRNAESTVLYGVVASELETFLARQQARERPVPKFVEDEFRAFLDCGVLARGFIRVRCESCGHDRLVPYSCKRRGWCASCGGRRMAETAAYLVDHVFPIAAVRQWVLSVPFALRYRLAYDPSLLSAVLNVFIRVVFGDLRRRARELVPAPRAHTRTYHGILAPAAKWRPLIVPTPEVESVSCGHLGRSSKTA